MFNWGDYIDLADELSTIHSSDRLYEAYCRAAVSRIYYAMHHRAKKYILTQYSYNFPKNTPSIHLEVIKYLNSIGKVDSGLYLDKLRKFRVDSDYNKVIVVDNRFILTSKVYSKTIIAGLK